MRDHEEFECSEERLRDMMSTHGHRGTIVWTFFEDYVVHRFKLFVGPVDRVANRFISKAIFEDVATYPFGIQLTMTTASQGDLYCAVDAPRSLSEAEHKMIAGVKLSIPITPPPCRVITNVKKWAKMTARREPAKHTEYLFGTTMRKVDLLDAVHRPS